jgi:hypothetical protein
VFFSFRVRKDETPGATRASAAVGGTDEIHDERNHTMSAMTDTYSLEFTGAEIAALADAVATVRSGSYDLDSGQDKLNWVAQFLDEPEQFASELRAMRVPEVPETVTITRVR